ncbi:hypothetical protein BFS06_14045 [Clostridium perfringens]|uniref:Uncharacterized protein n=1 Tax=Clostridium perfringens TaxID=1502 RepID=A0A140GRK8_CLOPF|nr:hypothetical protein [Clostridium perfringens]AMN31167.1 hypothetical protein JFP838_pA0251 [Clostridium perfringens]TBX14328.1 hypothetical protein BFS06_14045 [Clostridium perfringens]
MFANKFKIFKYFIVGMLLSLGIRNVIHLTTENISVFIYIKQLFLRYGFFISISLFFLFSISFVFLGLACEVFLLGISTEE